MRLPYFTPTFAALNVKNFCSRKLNERTIKVDIIFATVGCTCNNSIMASMSK